MKKLNDNNKLALQMFIAMVAGIVVGLAFMGIRENLGSDSATWITINNLLFQDITAAGAERFYIGGQIFIRALQLIIVPMVFSSVVMAINRPIEMLVTSLNVTGDAVTSMVVAKSEGKLNTEIFHK